jgi:hypothetical protein
MKKQVRIMVSSWHSQSQTAGMDKATKGLTGSVAWEMQI